MNNGEISGNKYATMGGGVYVVLGTFYMNGGRILKNKPSENAIHESSGGGVHISSDGTFQIVTGTIYGINNEADKNIAYNGSALYKGSFGTAQYREGANWEAFDTNNEGESIIDETINK
jgi:hypothetical protein